MHHKLPSDVQVMRILSQLQGFECWKNPNIPYQAVDMLKEATFDELMSITAYALTLINKQQNQQSSPPYLPSEAWHS